MLSEASDSQPTDLRKCRQCGDRPQGNVKLRRCGGCADPTAVYCSKECQKAAWVAGHKISCRRMSEDAKQHRNVTNGEARTLGYPSVQAFTKAFTDFLTAHEWALRKASLTHILLRTGPSMDIARANTQLEVLVYRFRSVPVDMAHSPERTPSNTFTLVENRFYNCLEYLTSGVLKFGGCASLLGDCQAFHEHQLTRNDPRYVGTIPILYSVDGMTQLTSELHPVYLPERTFVMTDFVNAALADVISVCLNSINAGISFQVNDQRFPLHPIPGCVVRSAGKWVWKPFFRNWEDYQEGRAECGRLEMLEGPRTRGQFLSLMDVYLQFWGIKPGEGSAADDTPQVMESQAYKDSQSRSPETQ